jgi:virginiamycin B lyase
MRSRLLLLAPVVCGLIALSPHAWDRPLQAQPRPDDTALAGLVSAADEGPLEGVLVSVRKSGSTITTTVVTDQSGRYRFPRARLEPGKYDMRIKATGYDLEASSTPIVAARTTTADLKLRKARDVAAQLSNAEWLASFPGTDAQKSSIRGCTHCHTLERIARTKYTADQMVAAIERMATYPQLSFPMKIQKLVAPRIGGGTISPEQQRATWRRQAEYLATINLSAAPQWT